VLDRKEEEEREKERGESMMRSTLMCVVKDEA
jgi:hypothetical protein